jgi:hypothetical protein
MKKFNDLISSTLEILHDLSSDRHEPDRFLSIKNSIVIVRKDFIFSNS